MTRLQATNTESLILRPVLEADADAIWRIHSDPKTNKYNPSGPMVDPQRAHVQAREWAADWSSHQIGYWAVEERAHPGHVVGFGGIHIAEWRGSHVYNLYYRLAPSVWGRGYATQIIDAAVGEWRKLSTDIPLIAYTTADNLPSQRTAEKGGLRRHFELDAVHDTYTDVVFALGLD
ncbi:hypothetical protein ALI44B_00705 [Leifsonia sp. ALI-44-B]|uniref:GNAT family N-acetyltransferase n=1 Tax=Leifsonia sp. ALI-44-B TaxID=1933776 RepID=UPI00097C2229|nr:GNAT family N-acetyltransferase [Leifsonia sp. ALI-44-B]ONI65245.1 hypothetical protein ALI44B_00705 [Leifsonia sp. ALI-44-B]